jgi:hypothetical protein
MAAVRVIHESFMDVNGRVCQRGRCSIATLAG